MKNVKTEKIFQRTGKHIVGSLNFTAYFPNLDIDACAEKVMETTIESRANPKVNFEALSLFLACTGRQHEEIMQV